MGAIIYYQSLLESKYHNVVKNKWIIWLIILIALLGSIGYAFYCASKGYNFSGQVRWHVPKITDISIGCTK